MTGGHEDFFYIYFLEEMYQLQKEYQKQMKNMIHQIICVTGKVRQICFFFLFLFLSLAEMLISIQPGNVFGYVHLKTIKKKEINQGGKGDFLGVVLLCFSFDLFDTTQPESVLDWILLRKSDLNRQRSTVSIKRFFFKEQGFMNRIYFNNI